MSSKKLLALICTVFAIVSAIFIALSVMSKLQVESPQAAAQPDFEYTVQGVVDYDSLAAPLAALKTNKQKTATYPDGILDKFKDAYAINSDLKGWLKIPGTEIDTAVVVADDNDFYLKRDFYKVRTTSNDLNYGILYLDYRVMHNSLSKNTVIYGHTTDKPAGYLGSTFRQLHEYKKLDFYIAHPIIEYSTLFADYKFKVCAVFLTNAKPADDNGYVFNYIYPHMSDTNMTGYIEQVKQRMLFETGVSLEETDKIITLSTCIYDYGSINTRLVVVGRLLHEGESESVDPSLVKARTDYRMPDAWCRIRGIPNPYRNSNTWKPSYE